MLEMPSQQERKSPMEFQKFVNELIEEIPGKGPLVHDVPKPEQYIMLKQWKKMLSDVIFELDRLPENDPRRGEIFLRNDRIISALENFNPKQGH